jgi:type I restriction enzyme, S subunit
MDRASSKLKTWNTSDLIDRRVLDIGDGYRAKNNEMGSIGLPFARAGNINGGFRFDDADILEERSVSRAGEKVAQSGDVVFTSKGTVGRFAFVKDDTPRFVYSPQLCYWRVLDRSVLNPKFLFYWMQTSAFLDQVHQVKGLTDMADYVSLADQRRMTISSPDIEAQNTIATMIGFYDDLIQNNERRIKILEEVAQLIYQKWFLHFDIPGKKSTIVAEASLGPVPAGWEIKSLDQLMDFQGGAQPPKSEWSDERREGYVRMIQIRDYQSDSHLCFVKDSKNLRKCNKYDIMIARYGASVARICEGLEGAYNVALVRVVPEKEAHREFLRSYLKSDNFQRLLIGMSGRTAQAGFNKTVLKSIQVTVPSDLALMNQFQSICVPIRELIQSLREANKKLVQTRDLLLPKLISGEISIECLETETASKIS